MNRLTLSQYDEAESSVISTMSNSAIAAFSPISFQHVNFPTHVSEEKSLVRFIDAMQDEGGAKFFDKSRRYSEYEQELITSVLQAVRKLSKAEFGKTVCPWSAPLSAVYPVRLISALSEWENRKLSVFEFGPGSGYLGSLLASANHK